MIFIQFSSVQIMDSTNLFILLWRTVHTSNTRTPKKRLLLENTLATVKINVGLFINISCVEIFYATYGDYAVCHWLESNGKTVIPRNVT